MKTSKFNTHFRHDNNIVLYNAYNNDFLILDPELHDLFLAGEREGIENLADIHPDFYYQLVDKEFVIKEDVDEIQRVKDLVHLIDKENEDTYSMIINPTMNCNFKCWYCYETHIKDSKMTEKTVLKISNHINLVLKNDKVKEFNLSWFGGEPLLYFNKTVLPLLEGAYTICKSKNVKFSSNFTTNGLLIDNDMLQKCKEFGVNHFQITLDGHRDRHNEVRYISKERGSYDEIVENIKRTLRHEMYVTVRLNISDETLNENLKEIITDFLDVNSDYKKFLNFSFHKVWQEEKAIDRDISELVDLFKKNKFIVTKQGDSDNVRNSCYADKKNQATINYNGEVFKCTARDFKSENKEGDLLENGVIEWNSKFDERMDAKFKNPPCLECKILPICNGGCSQNALENMGQDYCINDFDENKKTEIVKSKFLQAIS
jgi:uncharacterized protein